MTFHTLFRKLATAPTETELKLQLMDNLGRSFGVQRWGIYLLDRENNLISCDARGVSDRFIERYQLIGQSVDPLLQYVRDYHAPAHETLVLPQGTWKASQLYQRCCIEYDHEHIMTGPIVGNGRLIGTLNFARIGVVPAFSDRDLSNLGAVCLHVSACLASLRQQNDFNNLPSFIARENSQISLLTKREIQVVDLVAQGLTNAEIGKELWISQNTVKQALKIIFRKLEVSSRVEMVAKILKAKE